MFEKFRAAALGLSVIVILGGILAYIMVQSGGGKILGDPGGNLPPVAFETLERSFDAPSFLLCSKSLCKVAEADGPSQRFEVSAQKLRLAIVDFADNMPMIRTFRFDPVQNQFDFTERLPGETLPSVVTVRILETNPYSSELVIYSRTPLGQSNHEDHEERVARWLRLIESRLGL